MGGFLMIVRLRQDNAPITAWTKALIVPASMGVGGRVHFTRWAGRNRLSKVC